MKTSIKEVFKKSGIPITMVTAYDYPLAKLVEAAGIDAILVGDSVGNVVLGYESTVQVTMDEMLHHVRAVVRGVEKTPVIADMPFLSYQVSQEEALKNAGRLMRAGASAVKLEGGKEVAETVQRIVECGIPVMGHLGLTPQSVNQLGGYKVQGKSKEKAEKILQDAKLLEEAGVFAIVAECIPAGLAQELSEMSHVPIIGIGAGAFCDGQVLVLHDLLGFNDEFKPKFVKKYESLCDKIMNALKEYKNEVRNREFPGPEHSFFTSEEEMKKLY
ncbi:MAG: 3-methyl-2-oxobutanoate hydroxymethyltransferase [Clostridia bacterium]|jgi:3-methyl-2-oxobutanoate hydroxymethyltransferase|nr:3-methyl-2-oxobutanoate hydroxymethyltransferase [Clostridiales bacterium]MDK2986797.1 3-methyl-2-oxobutanoate hydroxymethyltransferase [Clostridia bacterium]